MLDFINFHLSLLKFLLINLSCFIECALLVKLAFMNYDLVK